MIWITVSVEQLKKDPALAQTQYATGLYSSICITASAP